MAVRMKRTEEAREGPSVTLLVRCPECGASALLRDIEDGKCPWCGGQIERKKAS